MEYEIQIARSEEQIVGCFPVMAELRPHLRADEFVARIRRQNQQAGYRLAYLSSSGKVQAVAGFRVGEYLAWGKAMYVDDLVTQEAVRSQGFGGQLLEWLVELARSEKCEQLHLDSGVQRFGAHRFYLGHGMDITSHHFALKL